MDRLLPFFDHLPTSTWTILITVLLRTDLRTVNKHYQEVIEELLPDTKVRGPRGGMVQMTSQEIKGHIEMLLRRNLLTSKNDIKYKAESKKQREKENIMQNIKYHINQKEQLVLEYRNIMQDHSY